MTCDRPARYLRVSLLSACNLNCAYCRPSGESGPALVADPSELKKAIAFLHSAGIRKIRFTGGEPTLHKDLVSLVATVKELDPEVFAAITTNGVRLAGQARALADAGLDSANVSIDTLRVVGFRNLTGKDRLTDVIAGIDEAIERIGQVKLNCVLMRGINDHEIAALVEFADRCGVDIRFIEYMPNRFSAPGDSRFVSGDEIRRELPWKLAPTPTEPSQAAQYYTSADLRIRVGFISPISHPFCAACNRLRLAADGRLYGCLFDSGSIDLFGLLRQSDAIASAELARLLQVKRFGGCRRASERPDDLPSFSALGG